MHVNMRRVRAGYEFRFDANDFGCTSAGDSNVDSFKETSDIIIIIIMIIIIILRKRPI